MKVLNLSHTHTHTHRVNQFISLEIKIYSCIHEFDPEASFISDFSLAEQLIH